MSEAELDAFILHEFAVQSVPESYLYVLERRIKLHNANTRLWNKLIHTSRFYPETGYCCFSVL